MEQGYRRVPRDGAGEPRPEKSPSCPWLRWCVESACVVQDLVVVERLRTCALVLKNAANTKVH